MERKGGKRKGGRKEDVEACNSQWGVQYSGDV